MGTRADFYVGCGKDAEWLGSVSRDGYQWEKTPDCQLLNAKTENDFRLAVADIINYRSDWISAKIWPWLWPDSNATDYVYAFHNGSVEVITDDREWPDMSV